MAGAADKLTANAVLALGCRAVEEAEEPLAECRVELAARAVSELTHGVVVGEGPTIRAMVGHGLVGLGDAGHGRHRVEGADEDLSPLGLHLSAMLHRATLLVARHPSPGARRPVSLPSRRSRRKAAGHNRPPGPSRPAGPGPLRE